MTWWNSSYKFRRLLSVSSEFEDVDEDHYVSAPFIAEVWYDRGKAREDFEDIEVVHEADDGTPTQTVLAREITDESINFYLHEPLEKGEEVEERYWIYYGNRELDAAPDRPEFDEDLWSTVRPYSDINFSFTRPGDHWEDGISNTPGAVATIRTYGKYLRVKSYTDINRGILEISIDGEDWEDIDLFSVTSGEDYVYETDELDEGRHRVRLRVSGRANPGSTGTKVNIVQVEYQAPVTVEDMGEEIYNFDWSSLMGGA